MSERETKEDRERKEERILSFVHSFHFFKQVILYSRKGRKLLPFHHSALSSTLSLSHLSHFYFLFLIVFTTSLSFSIFFREILERKVIAIKRNEV